MNSALIIIGLAMFIFIIVFSLKRAKEKKKAQQEEHEKIKAYGESIKTFNYFNYLILKKICQRYQTYQIQKK